MRVSESSGGFIKKGIPRPHTLEFLTEQIWGRAPRIAFLTNSQVMLRLPVFDHTLALEVGYTKYSVAVSYFYFIRKGDGRLWAI